MSKDIDKMAGMAEGYTEERTHIHQRYWVSEGETTLSMAKAASEEALAKAKLTIDDIDCVINAGVLVPQIIPSTSSLLLYEFGTSKQDCFDVDCTCLSFVKALDIADSLAQTKDYKHILIFTSEIASYGIQDGHHDVKSLFGDGAVAMILTKEKGAKSHVMGSVFQAFPDGGAFSQVRGGGTRTHPKANRGNLPELNSYDFEMQGPKVFKVASKNFPSFMKSVLEKANVKMEDIDYIIPHQASYQSIIQIQRRLGVNDNKVMRTIENYGNQVSVSIPNAFYDLFSSGQLKSGDKVMFLGAAAGLVLGAVVLQY
ncbi:MAG: 3-oxoacyl-[acyl-carrier-protein] synthase III C-terminal domain-containing protein [Hydrotalea sp.]|nr:3-oxoacyl-[acyl-carrier-protein] synthase III C-terminal domain-containing protein [Hydrotalea sp.]